MPLHFRVDKTSVVYICGSRNLKEYHSIPIKKHGITMAQTHDFFHYFSVLSDIFVPDLYSNYLGNSVLKIRLSRYCSPFMVCSHRMH